MTHHSISFYTVAIDGDLNYNKHLSKEEKNVIARHEDEKIRVLDSLRSTSHPLYTHLLSTLIDKLKIGPNRNEFGADDGASIYTISELIIHSNGYSSEITNDKFMKYYVRQFTLKDSVGRSSSYSKKEDVLISELKDILYDEFGYEKSMIEESYHKTTNFNLIYLENYENDKQTRIIEALQKNQHKLLEPNQFEQLIDKYIIDLVKIYDKAGSLFNSNKEEYLRDLHNYGLVTIRNKIKESLVPEIRKTQTYKLLAEYGFLFSNSS